MRKKDRDEERRSFAKIEDCRRPPGRRHPDGGAGAYCIDVIRQIQAVQAALNKVSAAILENHLNACVTTAIRGRTHPSANAS